MAFRVDGCLTDGNTDMPRTIEDGFVNVRDPRYASSLVIAAYHEYASRLGIRKP